MPVLCKKPVLNPDEIAVFIEEPTQKNKTTPAAIWKAFKQKFKFALIQSVLSDYLARAREICCANRQAFIDAAAGHSKCLVELYLSAAYFLLLLTVNMLAIGLIGFDDGTILIVTIASVAVQLVIFQGVRFGTLYFQSSPVDNKDYIKFSADQITKENVEQIRTTLDILRKRRSANLVYILSTTISLPILLCSVAIILVDILMLDGCSMLESIHKSAKEALLIVINFFLLFGAGHLKLQNADSRDKELFKFLQYFDIVHYRWLSPQKCHLLSEQIQRLFLACDVRVFCNTFTSDASIRVQLYETYFLLKKSVKEKPKLNITIF